MSISKEITYSDVSVSFIPHPVTGKLPIIKNQQSIANALKNLILTNKYERPYEPLFGGNILSLLFENGTAFLEYSVKKQIQECIQNFEPRVEILEIKVDTTDDNVLKISISFFIKNEKEPVTLNISLDRIR